MILRAGPKPDSSGHPASATGFPHVCPSGSGIARFRGPGSTGMIHNRSSGVGTRHTGPENRTTDGYPEGNRAEVGLRRRRTAGTGAPPAPRRRGADRPGIPLRHLLRHGRAGAPPPGNNPAGAPARGAPCPDGEGRLVGGRPVRPVGMGMGRGRPDPGPVAHRRYTGPGRARQRVRARPQCRRHHRDRAQHPRRGPWNLAHLGDPRPRQGRDAGRGRSHLGARTRTDRG